MSIHRTEPKPAITTGNAQQNFKMRPKSGSANAAKNADNDTAGTKVQLSALTQKIQNDDSQDIDTVRLAKIKAQMDAGTLNFDNDKIAHAIMKNIMEFKE